MTMRVGRGEATPMAFSAGKGGEALLEATMAAPGPARGRAGAGPAVVSLAVDGRHVTDVVVASATPRRRRLALGPLPAGHHELTFHLCAAASSASVAEVTVSDAAVEVVAARGEALLLHHYAPVLLGRSIAVTSGGRPRATTARSATP